MFEFLHRCCSSWSRMRRSPTAKVRGCSTRPLLEILQDRFAPAVLNVNTTADVLNRPAAVVAVRSVIEVANVTPRANTGGTGAAATASAASPKTTVTLLAFVIADGDGPTGSGAPAVTFPNALALPAPPPPFVSPPTLSVVQAVAAPPTQLLAPFSLSTATTVRPAADDNTPDRGGAVVPAESRPMSPDADGIGDPAEHDGSQARLDAVSTVALDNAPLLAAAASEGVQAPGQPVATEDHDDLENAGNLGNLTAAAAGDVGTITEFAGVVLTLLVGSSCGMGMEDLPPNPVVSTTGSGAGTAFGANAPRARPGLTIENREKSNG